MDKKKQKIYLDHQATTPLLPRVFEAMAEIFNGEVGNPHASDHAAGWQARSKIENVRQILADFVGGFDEGVIFTSGATEANNLALIGFSSGITKRRRLLVSAVEHKCVLAAADHCAEHYGFTVERIPVEQDGQIDIAAFSQMMDSDVGLVSVMAAQNEIGTIQNLRSIADIAHSQGALFHTDAAQAIVTQPLSDLSEIADLISLSAHKCGGPGGIGALYVRPDLIDQMAPLVRGGGQQSGLRSGTPPVALCVGFAEALKFYNLDDIEKRRIALRQKRDRFISATTDLYSAARLNGPNGSNRHIANANICFPGETASDLISRWQPLIAASTGAACVSGITEPSYVLRAIGLSEVDAYASVRFGLGFQTSDQDIDRALEIITSKA